METLVGKNSFFKFLALVTLIKFLAYQTDSQIHYAVRYCAQQIESKFEGQEFVVVCILKGCVYFFVDLTRSLTIPYSTYFIEASSYHNSQTQSESVELLRCHIFLSFFFCAFWIFFSIFLFFLCMIYLFSFFLA